MQVKREFDAVLFDFSGVLSTSPSGMMLSKVDELGITLEQFLPIALGPLEEDGDHPWHRAERGEFDLAGLAEMVEPLWREAGLSGFPTPPGADEFLATLQPIPEMVETARAVRAAGYRTAIVSNMISDWAGWRALVDADNLVDVVIDSAQVGLRKPSATIYELALKRLGVSAERALFLDDFPWNLPGAEALGITTMLVSDQVEAAAELRKRLSLAPPT